MRVIKGHTGSLDYGSYLFVFHLPFSFSFHAPLQGVAETLNCSSPPPYDKYFSCCSLILYLNSYYWGEGGAR